MTELSVECLQEALVISEPHLVLDELDLPSGKAHLSAEASCQGEEHVGVPIGTCEVDLDLASAFLQGFDCHGLSITQTAGHCTGLIYFYLVSVTYKMSVILPLRDQAPQ